MPPDSALPCRELSYGHLGLIAMLFFGVEPSLARPVRDAQPDWSGRLLALFFFTSSLAMVFVVFGAVERGHGSHYLLG